jgi:hypothetical protein
MMSQGHKRQAELLLTEDRRIDPAALMSEVDQLRIFIRHPFGPYSRNSQEP